MTEADEELESERTVVTQAFTPGSFFSDRFRIERLLGMGGMGSVYEATDLETDRRVALKVLKKKRALSEEAGERFRREAEILGSADHPGIVGIHDFGHSADGQAWLAMELLEGETLRERVQRKGAIAPEQLAPILRAAAEALQQAHARGVVHRDLKPDHLFLPADGNPPVKILDFGLSLAQGSKKLTKTGTVIGTPRYMSPQQIASAHKSDAQADVYALGVIVYEALAGQSPFVASDHGQLLGAILQGRIEPLSSVRPELDLCIERAVQKAMAPQVEDRYKSPLEFADSFEEAVRYFLKGECPPEAGVDRPPEGRPRFAAQEEAQARFRASLVEPAEERAAPPSAERNILPWWVLAVGFVAGASLAAAGAFVAYAMMH